MTRIRKTGRSTAVAATVAAIGLTAVLTGCSHDSNHSTAKTAAAASGTAKAITTVPKADNIVNDPKARPSVSMPDLPLHVQWLDRRGHGDQLDGQVDHLHHRGFLYYQANPR